jgi:hypothetical protein
MLWTGTAPSIPETPPHIADATFWCRIEDGALHTIARGDIWRASRFQRQWCHPRSHALTSGARLCSIAHRQEQDPADVADRVA